MRLVIESRRTGRVVGEAASVREAVRFLDGAEVEVVVLDVSMPGSSGLSLLHELRRRKRREKVLVVTMHAYAELAAEAFSAGATGFALKTDSADLLGQAIDSVAAGQRWVTPGLPLETIESFLTQRGAAGGGAGVFGALTVRERQVLELLVRDYSQDAIAAELCISPKTVDSHRAAIFRKLNVPSRFALLRFAFRHHLVYDLDGVSSTKEGG
jgi:two-component system, NarL family, response regulator NreC